MRIAVIGLGYVGLPLAAALSEHFETLGYDISAARIGELKAGNDRTGELTPERLATTRLRFTANADDIAGRDIFIVAVPTPLDAEKRPDLGAVLAASETVGARLGSGAVVVFESTVWPGVTEDICVPVLERASGLAAGEDFHVGYAPERMNPAIRSTGSIVSRRWSPARRPRSPSGWPPSTAPSTAATCSSPATSAPPRRQR